MHKPHTGGLMALQRAPIALLCKMRLICQLVILAEVLTWFAACHLVWRQRVNPHLWQWLAVCGECFFAFPGRWQTVCMMARWHAVYRRSTDCPAGCVCVCGRPWTMNTGHIFSRSAFYRCSQKSHYLQGRVAHSMCLKKWCGQVWKVHITDRSSHLTQAVTAIPSTFMQLESRSASVSYCQGHQVDGLFWQRTSASALHASQYHCLQSGHVFRRYIWVEIGFPCWAGQANAPTCYQLSSN